MAAAERAETVPAVNSQQAVWVKHIKNGLKNQKFTRLAVGGVAFFIPTLTMSFEEAKQVLQTEEDGSTLYDHLASVRSSLASTPFADHS